MITSEYWATVLINVRLAQFDVPVLFFVTPSLKFLVGPGHHGGAGTEITDTRTEDAQTLKYCTPSDLR